MFQATKMWNYRWSRTKRWYWVRKRETNCNSTSRYIAVTYKKSPFANQQPNELPNVKNWTSLHSIFYYFFFNLFWFMCSFCIMHQNPTKIHSQGKGSGRDWEVFCVYSVLWLFQIWNEQTYQENRRDPSILHLIFMQSLPGMSECLKLTPLLFCPTGKAEKAECKALQGSKTTGLTVRA